MGNRPGPTLHAPRLRTARPGPYGRPMEDDDAPRPAWQDKLPYVIGVLGLLAWFALLYFMLRDVA